MLETEKAAQDDTAAAHDYLSSSASDLIPLLARGGEDAASAWDQFTRSFEAAAWQTLLLGEWPLMALLSMSAFGSGIGLGRGGAVGFIGKLLGFANGGFNGAAANLSGAKAKIKFIDQSSGAQMTKEERACPKGGRLARFVINDRMGQSINEQGSSARKALRQGFGLSPVRPLR